MISILNQLQEFIREEDIKLSKKLVDQIQNLASEKDEDLIREIDEQVWALSELQRKNQILGRRDLEASRTSADLSKAISQKISLKFQADHKRDSLFSQLDNLNRPIINYACDLVVDSIKTIGRARQHRLLNKGMFSNGRPYYEVSTNRDSVIGAIELLLELKGQLRKMYHVSIDEIFEIISSCEAQLSSINFRSMKMVEMTQMEWDSERRLIDGEKALVPLPLPLTEKQLHYQTIGEFEEMLAKGKVKDRPYEHDKRTKRRW